MSEVEEEKWKKTRRREVPFVLVGHMDHRGMLVCRVHRTTRTERTWGRRLRFANQVGGNDLLFFLKKEKKKILWWFI
jgi:hypothetical protein